MTPDTFRSQIAALTQALAGRPIDSALGQWLNSEHDPGSTTYKALRESCEAGVAEGWLCNREAHHPTVRKGRALVLYLLPQGQIQFTQGATA
nr:hypothetical protein NCPCFENI_00614 [Cupriavidus sp.]